MAQDHASIALSDAAQALRESARAHKRAAAWHRRRAQEDMQRLAKLRQFCEANGIKLEIKQAEAGSHGRQVRHPSS